MGTELSWIEYFYSHFLGRDICYLFSGGLFISVVEYEYWGELYLPKGFSLEVVGFLMLSYFVGISISAIETIISKSGRITAKSITPNGYSNLLSLNQALAKNYEDKILNNLERMIFMMTASQNVGLSSLLGGSLMIILALIRLVLRIEGTTVESNLLAFSLLFFGILMIFDSRFWCGLINKTWQELADEIVIKEQK